MDYAVELAPAAERDLNRLSMQLQDRLLPRIAALSTDPRPSGCKKLSPLLEGYRIRVGDYRIVYHVDDVAATVTITKVAKRDEAYR